MAFDTSVITGITLSPDMGELVVSWTTTAPTGSMFQVYVAGRLAWWGQGRSTRVPMPTEAAQVVVGQVGANEGHADYSGSLPTEAGPKHARLSWEGGTYLGTDIHSFRVYGEATPGGGVSYAAPLAEVLAYSMQPPADGFGMGLFGGGGFGASGGTYTWESAPLSGGTWSFAVKAVDATGNESTAATASVVIAAPPNPPAANAAGRRLTNTYNATTKVITLNWLASA